MSNQKTINLDLKAISNLTNNLEMFSNELTRMQDSLSEDIASTGLIYLQNQYASSKKDDNITDINPGIEKTMNGYNIISSGKDVIYEEFGTGDKGEKSPYKGDKSKYNLNEYNSGKTIIDISKISNQSILDELATHGIVSGKFWSYSKNGDTKLTQGVPAGMEMYNTDNQLKDVEIRRIVTEKVSDALSKV